MATVARARTALRRHALSLAGAWEDHPWGENVAKVGKKVFVFFGLDGPDLFVGVKLDRSLNYARSRTYAHKFGYGLDKAGWVSLRFAKDADVPVAQIREWIEESHAAVAPTAAASSSRAPTSTSARRSRAGSRPAAARPSRERSRHA